MKRYWFVPVLFLIAVPIAAKPNYQALGKTYADIAHAAYQDSLITAKHLQKEVRKLVTKPSEQQLQITRQAWRDARVPYSQTEVFRFANTVVDDWEGKVNAWPLDEGLIDYIVKKNDSESTLNVIANQSIKQGESVIDTRKITGDLLEQLHELGDIETNVATGYHAIEFLLWGQDLNGVAAGAGQRPATDFDLKNCSDKHCFRRTRYLMMVVDLLIKELTWMMKQWEADTSQQKYVFTQSGEQFIFPVGTARQALAQGEGVVADMLRGMGSLAYGELAGERMKLGLLLHDPEEEQDCFSDNTHWAHFYNLKGIENIFYGRYTRVDGSQINGHGLVELLVKDKPLQQQLENRFQTAFQAMQRIVHSAEQQGIAYDQLLGKDNSKGHQLIDDSISSLLELSNTFFELARSLGFENIVFEGSATLDQEEEFF